MDSFFLSLSSKHYSVTIYVALGIIIYRDDLKYIVGCVCNAGVWAFVALVIHWGGKCLRTNLPQLLKGPYHILFAASSIERHN